MTKQVERHLSDHSLLGYCWPWTGRAGDRIDFMVHSERENSYRAELVRIRCADNLAEPSMIDERVVAAPFAREYPGRRQHTEFGSYVEVGAAGPLDELSSFTAQLFVFPTFLKNGFRGRLGGYGRYIDHPVPGEQHLVSRWTSAANRGWALRIDADGHPSFIVGDDSEIQELRLDRPLIQDQWFLLSISYDASTGEGRISALHRSPLAVHGAGWPAGGVEKRKRFTKSPPQEGALRFAACSPGIADGMPAPSAHCFNGRLDRIRLSATALTAERIAALAEWPEGTPPPADVTGFWDFAADMGSRLARDLSPNALHGEVINMPLRAAAGVGWDGRCSDWRACPAQYSAIHFHDDDLYDARWDVAFSFTIPDDLPSGIYAARLSDSSTEDYIPFFVAPRKGEAHAAVALLIPTATYTAYTNIADFTLHTKRPYQYVDARGETLMGYEDISTGVIQDASQARYFESSLSKLAKGIYASHTDGTLATHASQRCVNLAIKPKGMQWTLVADSLLVDWLEEKGFAHDIITDELLHDEGAELLARYPVLITSNHPEYYSHEMLDALRTYQRDGGRLMYLGGNGFFWVTSFNTNLPGSIEVRKHMLYSGHSRSYEMHHAADGVRGGTWEYNGRAPHQLVGVGTDVHTGFAFEGAVAFRRLEDSHDPRAAFIFDGVSSDIIGDYGRLGGGAAGLEIDSSSAERGTPPHALRLAVADHFPLFEHMLKDRYAINATTPLAEVVYFETPRGGAVFSAGSMSWVGALSHAGYDNDISRITENVLVRFLSDEPIAYPIGPSAGSDPDR